MGVHGSPWEEKDGQIFRECLRLSCGARERNQCRNSKKSTQVMAGREGNGCVEAKWQSFEEEVVTVSNDPSEEPMRTEKISLMISRCWLPFQ